MSTLNGHRPVRVFLTMEFGLVPLAIMKSVPAGGNERETHCYVYNIEDADLVVTTDPRYFRTHPCYVSKLYVLITLHRPTPVTEPENVHVINAIPLLDNLKRFIEDVWMTLESSVNRDERVTRGRIELRK